MQLEQQVVSLDLAKHLKELGVKQDSYFGWWERYNNTPLLTEKPLKETAQYRRTAAFTVAELGSLLPPGTISYFDPHDDWQCKTFKQHEKHIKREWSEADARAKMLIHLLEHNLITPSSTTEVPPHAVPV